jgi:hypothetical protein
MQEVPLFPWWLTLIFAIWAAVGPLIGIFVGSHITRRWQREQWVRDQELKEWRELISAVASVEASIPILIDEGLDLDALKQAILRVVPYLQNRLFINEYLREIGFGEEWNNELLKFALSDLPNAKNSLDYARTHSATNMSDTRIESAYQKLKQAKIEIRNRYGKLQEKLRQTSQKCLRT